MQKYEETWFDRSTWNHEKTVKVVIVTRDYNPMVIRMTKDYLKNLGFSESNSIPNDNAHKGYRFFVVDMVDRTFERMNVLRKTLHGDYPIAYPSQILLYMQSNRGMLMGKRFGL